MGGKDEDLLVPLSTFYECSCHEQSINQNSNDFVKHVTIDVLTTNK